MPQPSGADRYVYERHRPEETPLYRIVETHYPRFRARLEAEGGSLPAFVKREFDDYLKCGLLEHGFLRVKCDACSHEHLVAFSCKRRGFCPSCGARRMIESAAHLVDHVLPEQPIRQWVLTFPYPLRFLFAAQPQVLSQVLGVVYRAISTDLLKRTGFTVASGAKTGAVTLIQRFGSALNLNIHFHMLFLDGAYRFGRARPRFHRAPRPTSAELVRLLHTISTRLARLLERRGLLVRDAESDYLDFEPGEALDQLIGASIRYRIAIGPNAGRKALTLRTVPAQPDPLASTLLVRQPGFSLHAATCCEAKQRDKLEKLCRYITRPAIANERLSTNERGQVIYRFKQPFRDGTTHVVLDPLDFIARLAALVPRPRLNLTRFHGVFAPNCKLREHIVPRRQPTAKAPDKPLAPMTWMQRLKRGTAQTQLNSNRFSLAILADLDEKRVCSSYAPRPHFIEGRAGAPRIDLRRRGSRATDRAALLQ